MTNIPQGYERILVATDFSPHAEAALKQAVWLARQNGPKIVVMHTLPDRLRQVHSETMRAQLDLLYGEGETVPREVRQKSEARMQQMIVDLKATNLDVRFETWPGEPFGVLLGNTAERILDTCDGSILAVKPADFVSPIGPFVSPLPPGSAEEVP